MHLLLTSSKGNSVIPTLGYLGLTPVTIQGAIRTRLDDGKTAMAKTLVLTIRCYEQRIGRVGSIIASHILFEKQQTLWSSPGATEYSEIGEMDWPFRVVLPPDIAGCSTVSYPDYRIFWRLEAALYHAPIIGVGSRLYKHHEIPLIRHDLPSSSTRGDEQMSCAPDEIVTAKSHARLRYRVECPTAPIGPRDEMSVLVSIMPLDSTTSVRSASLIVERRMELKDNVAKPTSESSSPPSHIPAYHSPQQSIPIPKASSSSTPSTLSKSYQDPTSPRIMTHGMAQHSRSNPPSPILDSSLTSSVSESTVTDSEQRQLLQTVPPPPLDGPKKTVNATVAFADSQGRFERDREGLWSKCLTLQWPMPKSSGRWAVGETMTTNLVVVRFFVKVKVVISSPSATESVELAEEELIVVPTNDLERQAAIEKYNDQLNSPESARAKSKSPRRQRHDRAPDAIPSVPPRPATSTLQTPSSIRTARPGSRHGPSRRPHTSAGPSDRPSEFTGRPQERSRPRPDTANADASGSRSRGTLDNLRGLIAPRINSVNSSSSSNTSSGTDPEDEIDLVEVQAWEQELARIEIASRRSSADMLGFFPSKGKQRIPDSVGIRIHQ